MGCDIHAFVERFIDEDGTWQALDIFQKYIYGCSNSKDGNLTQLEINISRNYFLFSKLAGVRRYSEDEESLDEPRGIPEDLSPGIKSECLHWEDDGHSHSYFLFSEIFENDFEFNFVDELHEMIDRDSFLKIYNNDHPPMYDGFMYFPSLPKKELLDGGGKFVSNKDILTSKNKFDYTTIRCINSYSSAFREFLYEKFSPAIELEPDQSKLRLVFWFDN